MSGHACHSDSLLKRLGSRLERALGVYTPDHHPTDYNHISIDVKNLTVSYGNNCVLSEASYQFNPKSLTAIVGPNGGGKSTFLKAILAMQKNYTGHVHFKGICAHDVAYLAQHNLLDRRFPLTVGDVISLGLFKEVGLFRGIGRNQQHKIMHALERVGMSGAMGYSLQSLSGGQFQRVLFARLILQNAPVIFLDEPFTGVDEQTVKDLMGLIMEWHDQGRLIIAVLHDFDLVANYFPDCVLIARRIIASGKTKSVLSDQNILEATKAARKWEARETNND